MYKAGKFFEYVGLIVFVPCFLIVVYYRDAPGHIYYVIAMYVGVASLVVGWALVKASKAEPPDSN